MKNFLLFIYKTTEHTVVVISSKHFSFVGFGLLWDIAQERK